MSRLPPDRHAAEDDPLLSLVRDHLAFRLEDAFQSVSELRPSLLLRLRNRLTGTGRKAERTFLVSLAAGAGDAAAATNVKSLEADLSKWTHRTLVLSTDADRADSDAAASRPRSA